MSIMRHDAEIKALQKKVAELKAAVEALKPKAKAKTTK